MATQQHQSALPPADLKRKRSPSQDTLHAASAPLSKAAKTSNHLQINYLARHLDEDLPLITNDDTLPSILALLTNYQGVLDRHESMACNLGARPLGPILIKRFERLFDGPPRVLKSHSKDGATVSWLDVVEFARNKPEQFQLGQMSEGIRVCQFYTKQCRVQISEEDFVLISSGIPQKMIPPQPIIEDEEKELGTIEILEKNLAQICQLADQVAARTRQLNHRLKGRKQAILDRRATAGPAPPIPRPLSPSNVALMNGSTLNLANHPPQPPAQAPSQTQSQSPSGGFVAVNSRPQHESNGSGAANNSRHDLMNKFHTLTERRPASQPPNNPTDARRLSVSAHGISHPSTPVTNPTRPPSNPPDPSQPALARPIHLSNDTDLHSMMASPVPIPNTPSSLLPAASQRNAQPQEKDDGGPFKAEMVHRMESLAKGDRIMPPCDRCRRLHMDCLKNLTACMGCTKKHAKCAWKEVREPELRGSFALPFTAGAAGVAAGTATATSSVHSETSDHESGDAMSLGSPGVMSPQRHYAPAAASGHTAQPQPQPQTQAQSHAPQLPPLAQEHHTAHASSTQPQQQQQQHYDRPHPARTTPPARSPQPHHAHSHAHTHTLEQRSPHRSPSSRHLDAQLQDAAKSGLAHAAHGAHGHGHSHGHAAHGHVGGHVGASAAAAGGKEWGAGVVV